MKEGYILTLLFIFEYHFQGLRDRDAISIWPIRRLTYLLCIWGGAKCGKLDTDLCLICHNPVRVLRVSMRIRVQNTTEEVSTEYYSRGEYRILQKRYVQNINSHKWREL